MKIVKKRLDTITRCYCASNLPYDNENHILFASEDPNVMCAMFSGKDFEKKEILWNEPGGCMSIIPLPNAPKEFLAVQEFYLKVSPSLSKIVWGKKTEEGYVYKDVLTLPYIHRFDVYEQDGVCYFIGATIAESKENKEDWSKPGKIYVGVLPTDLNQGIQVEVLVDGLYKNHGYWHDEDADGVHGYFGCEQGVLKVTPPRTKNAKWSYEWVLEGTISEMALIDIDQDGEKEMMTIEPFHGNCIKIYKRIEGAFKEVYEYDNEIDFAHTLVGANLRGVPTFLAGVRRKDAELFYVQYKGGNFVTEVLDTGVGPANIIVVNEKDRDIIVAANHTQNEAAVYIVSDEV